jgi:2'-5' RNA ligase
VGGDRASRPEAKPWRLFVAADVPDGVRSRLAEQLEPLRRSHPELRWTPQENWHVTLKFLGAVWPRLVVEVEEAVAKVAAATGRFDTSLLGPDAFPNVRRVRVVWIAMTDLGGRFAALAGALDEALGRIVKPEERQFTPHLTVARARQPVALGDALEAARTESAAFPVDRIVLYRSHLRRPAPLYEPVQTFSLRTPSPGR